MSLDIMDCTEEKVIVKDSVVTAKDFMDNIYLSVAFDEMQGCVEAAPSDCPYEEILNRIFFTTPSREKLRECVATDDKLSSFVDSALSSNSLLSTSSSEDREGKSLEDLCRLAQRVHAAAKKLPVDAQLNKWRHRCHQPLVDGIDAISPLENVVLPNMQVPLPENEASQWIARSALQVRDVEVMSILGVKLDEEFQKSCIGKLPQSSSSTTLALEESGTSTILESLSPFVTSTHPGFYCAAFHSSSNGDCHNPSDTKHFYRLHRYNHLATTSLVRQLFAFEVHLPVIGVLLCGSRIAFHVDWATQVDGRVEIDSALYTPDEMEEDFRLWDLCDPADALEVVLILDNIRCFALGEFRSAVMSGLSDFRSRIHSGDFKAWRWDGKMVVDRGEGNFDEYEESPSLSSVETEGEELNVNSPEDLAVNVRVQDQDGQTDEDKVASIELLTAALTLEQKSGIGRRTTKRLLPSPPRTPAEESGHDAQTPAS